MRFEVVIDDGTGDQLTALHAARDAWNKANQDKQAPDAPSFVQALVDKAVADALAASPVPTSLPAALDKITQLEAENAALQSQMQQAISAQAAAGPISQP